MTKKTALIAIFLVGLAQLISLFWIRSEYRAVLIDGAEYEVVADIDFAGDFYNRNYILCKIDVPPLNWKDGELPAVGEEVYVPITKDDKGLLQFGNAGKHAPSGDYITTRVKTLEEGKIHVDFPASKMYLSQEELKRISVVELSERVQFKEDGEEKKSETRRKNIITAMVRVKDGAVAVSKLLADGSPVEHTYRTVGTTLRPVYQNGENSKEGL